MRMATLSLKISLDEGKVVKTIQFDPSTTVYDACKIIREKLQEATLGGEPKDYGLFLSSEDDPKKGVWMEPTRNLDYYMLRNGDVVEYKRKLRTLRVRMLDDSVKTLMVDDSQIVANLMVVICTKIGITNYDEYSLVRDDPKDEVDNIESKPNYGTLTLKRKTAEKERDAKMDQLRKKLRTDDEVNWVDPSKTLREQGVEESEMVLLQRKFFFSDRNIDSRDPIQLGLLYVQARNAIVDGTHPVTQDKACEFAGIQCQIQFGDHREERHIAGFLDLKEFLPASYAKVKGIEKKVFKEHRKHQGTTELEAKVLYTKTARALKTYGVAFFLVKEKMKGKNKLVPRLLGVTKDSVLRLDEKTKEILYTWPLTTVRRWCASANTFTLDFGDYSDQYYSVQTTEAEQILQVISGYIDIILKKQKAKDHFGIEGDEGSTMVEDSVSPSKATILQHESSKIGKVNTESLAKPAVMRAGNQGVKPYSTGHLAGAQYTTVSGQITIGHTPPNASQSQAARVTSLSSEPQRALLSTITMGREIIEMTERELVRAPIPELGSDAASLKWKEVQFDNSRQAVTSQIAAMNAATAQVVTLTSGSIEEVDHTAVGAAITTITTNLPEMTKGVQMLAALMDDTDNGDKLLNATRKLCSAFSDLLKAAEPETKEPRQNLLNAASRVGEASTQVLHNIGEDTEENKEIQDILLALAKAVANTTAALVLKAKNIAATCRDDQQVQNRVITAATQCALATSQLVACAKVVAPTLHNPACREQLTSAARSVARAVEGLLQECANAAPQSDNADDKLMQELTAAAQQVTEALNRMLEHVNFDRRAQADTRIQESSVESVMTATDRLISSSTDAAEMVKQARLLGQATAHLIQSIKTEAEGQPELGQQRRLLAAAKLLAEATARMVEAARACASSPRDSDKRQALCRAAEELRDVAADYAAAGDGQGRGQIARLQDAAKQAASEATQLISSVQSAGAYNTNKHSQELVLQECKILSDTMPKLVEGVKICSARPTEAVTQLDLINASEAFLQASGHVAQASRAILPTVQDQAAAKQLGDTTQHFTASCTELRTAVNRARASCKGLELDAATELIKCLQYELEEVDRAAKAFQLRPLPGETAESASQSLSTATRGAASATAALVSAARHGGAPRAAGDAAAALQHFTSSVRAVVATNDHQPTRERVIQSGQDVLQSSITLIETVKYYLSTSETVETTHLISIAKDITQALEQTSEAVPSHREVDSTMENITETMQILSMGEFPPTDKTYGQLQNELNTAAEYLNLASSDVVQSVEVPASLGEASKHFGQNFNRLMGVSMEMAGQTKDYEAQSQMVSSMRTVSTSSSKLLNTAKSVSQDLGRPNAKNQLANAARDVTDAINQLVDVCTSAAPGQKECDSAVRRMRSAGPLLQHPSEPVNDHNYFSCVDTIVVHSKTLSEGMSGMANSAKHSNYDKFVTAVRDVSDSICGLVECTAQAAYLVAVSDESSVAGRAGLVDQAQFARAAQAIQQACDGVVDPNSNQQQVLSAATVIAKHTSALCNACRVASGKTANPAAKRHFVQAAKDVANSTAALVKEIKALDNDYSQANRSRCGAATAPLLEAVRGLCQYADSPEFASVPAKISPQARRSQDAILKSGRNIISGACSMVESARALVVQPADRPQWQQLAAHTNTVSHAIKALVTGIRDKAPGQRECLAALDTINNQIRELDQASLSAVSQSLVARRGNTLQGYTEQMETVATEIIERLEPLRNAAKFEAENLGHSTVQLVSYIEPLVAATVGAASNITESRVQMSLLDQSKTVLEGTAQLVLACKDSGGNPRATAVHADVDEHTNSVREAAEELTSSVRTLTTQHGLVSGPIEAVQRALARITDHRMSLIGAYNESDAFVDYQTRMVGAAKEIARLSTDMTVKSGTDVTKLAALGGELSQRFGQLAQDSVGASATTPSPDVAQSIRSCVVELGEAVVTLIKAGGQCQLSADSSAQRSVADSARSVNAKVGNVLSALQAGSKGTQACTDSVSTIAAIIGDLDTTILFASAGTLHAEKDNDTFAEHREGILKTARTLVEDTKTLVGGAAGTQEQLADAAQQAVLTIVQLSEVVKAGAASLSVSVTPESQVLLLHAVRDVASALKDLVHATKLASGKPIQHPAMDHLKECAKVMVTNVTSLLKTVKAVEDEHTRGTRALEATIESIAQEIKVFLSGAAPRREAAPEDLLRCTRGITVATAKAVAAGNSGKQDDIVAAANLGRKAVSDMLAICKGAAYHHAESGELRDRCLCSGRDAAQAYRTLLQAVAAGDPTQLPARSRDVAQAVAQIATVAEQLKGSDWVDPDDPTVIAESELLGAAASIDAAANKLAALRPRKNVKEADENLNFDEMILEAAKSIISATSALVRAASAAQRELIDQGAVARRPVSSSDDGQWSEGLVSAARLAAAAAHSLAEAANALVLGLGSEERLIGAAKQVASSTAQLLVACKVKADPNSESTRRLQAAGAAVIRSTDNLVRAARQAISHEEDRCLVLDRRMVGGIAQEIDARSEVVRIERELEEARVRLTAIRQAKYKLKTGDTSGDETDNEITLHSSDLNSGRQDGYASDVSGRFRSTYQNSPTSPPHSTSFGQNTNHFNQNTSSYGQNSTNFGQNTLGNTSFGQTTNVSYGTTPGSKFSSSPSHTLAPKPSPLTFSASNFNNYPSNVQIRSPTTDEYQRTENNYTNTLKTNTSFGQNQQVSPLSTFSSFGRSEVTTPVTPKTPTQYQGFTTRYETRSYETPRPIHSDMTKTEETRMYESHQSEQHSSTFSSTRDDTGKQMIYDTPRPVQAPIPPMTPTFDARSHLKFETDKSFERMKPGGLGDGTGQTFNEIHKSTEKIPGGEITSETKIKSESYQSRNPREEFFKDTFTTSTPSKFGDRSPGFSKLSESEMHSTLQKNISTDLRNQGLVKIATPDSTLGRVSSPYGKEVHSYGGPNYMQESSTEVKEIPNGTQKITMTKIYSSSPVTITSTNTKYDLSNLKPIKLDGLDELSKSFDQTDSRFGTLDSNYSTDSKFGTLDSKLSSHTSRSFMRPSDFQGQTSEYQTSSAREVKKPSDLVREIDTVGDKLRKQTISSETIERKTVVSSSTKSETSSTTTKKFGNF